MFMKLWDRLLQPGVDLDSVDTKPKEEEGHTHDFVVIAKSYGAPRQDISLPQHATERMIEKSLFGATYFLSECIFCKERRSEELIGSEGNRLDDVLDQIDESGNPYYLKRNGQAYVVGKYAPLKQEGVVPLR